MQSSNHRSNPNVLMTIVIAGITLGLLAAGLLNSQNDLKPAMTPTPDQGYFFTVPVQPTENVLSLNLQTPKAGSAAPDFELPDRFGNAVRLSDLAGSVVVINFWASWCQPCREEMPVLQAISDKFADQGLVVLGVNTTYTDSLDEALAFVDELKLTFPILFDETGEVGEKKYMVYGLPTSYWVDRRGIIQSVQLGAMTEDQMLEILTPLLEP